MTSSDNRYNQHTGNTSPEKDRSADVMFCLLLRLFCFRPMSYFVCNSDSFVSQSSVSWCDGWTTLQRELIFYAQFICAVVIQLKISLSFFDVLVLLWYDWLKLGVCHP